MGNLNKETPIKKSKKGLVAVLAIVIIAILAGVGYYFLRPVTARDLFISKINATIDESAESNSAKSEAINSTLTLSGNIESDSEEIKQVADYINQGKFTLNLQADKKAKKVAVSASVDYQGENLLSGKVFYANDDNIYVYVQDLFDKYFKFNLKEVLEDEGSLQGIFEESNLSLGEKINLSKANKILKNEISENLKEEYFVKEEVDGMKKNTLKLTVGELRRIVIDVITSLKDNQDYLNCYEKPDEIKASFEDVINSISKIENDYDSYTVEISLYTRGISKDVQKVDVRVVASDTEEGTFTINKIDDDNYEFNLIVKAEQNNMPVTAEALSGTIKREKVDDNTEKVAVVVDNIPEVGKVTLNIEVKEENTTDLESIDVSNSVDINNLSQTDAITLYTNLMNMKIYSLLAPLMGSMY